MLKKTRCRNRKKISNFGRIYQNIFVSLNEAWNLYIGIALLGPSQNASSDIKIIGVYTEKIFSKKRDAEIGKKFSNFGRIYQNIFVSLVGAWNLFIGIALLGPSENSSSDINIRGVSTEKLF